MKLRQFSTSHKPARQKPTNKEQPATIPVTIPKTNISRLPPELIENILRYLPPKDIYNAFKINKAAMVQYRDGMAARVFSGIESFKPSNIDELESVLNETTSANRLNKLDLSQVRKKWDKGSITRGHISRVTDRFKPRVLSISNCEWLTDTALYEMIKANHFITELNVRGCKELTNDGIIMAARLLPNLKILDTGGRSWRPQECSNLLAIKSIETLNITDSRGFAVAGNLNAPNLKTLIASNCEDFTGSGLDAPKLEILNASNCKSFTGANLNAPGLIELSASGCPKFTGADLNAPKLEILHASNCGSFTGADLNAPDLRYLKASNCKSFTGVGLNAPGLKYLNASGCKNFIGVDSLGLIELQASSCPSFTGKLGELKAPSLKKLDASGCENFTAIGLTVDNLIELKVSGCDKFTGATLHASNLKTLIASNCKSFIGSDKTHLKLESLYVTDCKNFTGAGLNAPALKYLDASRCENFTGADLNAAGLIELNASQCHSFTGANLNAHNLKSLDASRCNSFTTGANLNTPNLIALNLSDSGFQGNVPNSPNLELLDISLCNHINASVLTSSMANKVNLRVLTNDDYGRQSNCGRFNNNRNDWITNDVLIGLLANNKCIESIDIGGRIAIELTNSGLRAALKEAGNLKRLSIKGCPGITDEGLMDALQGKDKLNYLNVQSCDVTDAAIKSLRKKFPRATIIDQKGKEVPNLSASHLTRLDKGSNHSIVAGI